jgi:hypothetical protein
VNNRYGSCMEVKTGMVVLITGVVAAGKWITGMVGVWKWKTGMVAVR